MDLWPTGNFYKFTHNEQKLVGERVTYSTWIIHGSSGDTSHPRVPQSVWTREDPHWPLPEEPIFMEERDPEPLFYMIRVSSEIGMEKCYVGERIVSLDEVVKGVRCLSQTFADVLQLTSSEKVQKVYLVFNDGYGHFYDLDDIQQVYDRPVTSRPPSPQGLPPVVSSRLLPNSQDATYYSNAGVISSSSHSGGSGAFDPPNSLASGSSTDHKKKHHRKWFGRKKP
ncbi:hypothetical protein T439DRAFT_369310 [Meredithblackwellia eburnea MCA 4105]